MLCVDQSPPPYIHHPSFPSMPTRSSSLPRPSSGKQQGRSRNSTQYDSPSQTGSSPTKSEQNNAKRPHDWDSRESRYYESRRDYERRYDRYRPKARPSGISIPQNVLMPESSSRQDRTSEQSPKRRKLDNAKDANRTRLSNNKPPATSKADESTPTTITVEELPAIDGPDGFRGWNFTLTSALILVILLGNL